MLVRSFQKKSFLRFIPATGFFFAFLGLLSVTATAQFTSVGNTVSTPIPYTGHEYIQALNDTIDPANGALSIRLQVPVNKGRGITMPFSFNYDSNGAVIPSPWPADEENGIVTWTTNYTDYSNDGWSYGLPLLNHVEHEEFQGPQGAYDCWYGIDYNLQNSDGGRFDFTGLVHDYQEPHCASRQHPYSLSNQGQYYASVYAGNVLVNDRTSGTVYSFDAQLGGEEIGSPVTFSLPYQIEDRNGNLIQQQPAPGTGAFKYADTLGNPVLSATGFGSTGDTVTAGAQTYTLTWGNVNVAYPLYSVQAASNAGYCGNLPPNAGFSGPVLKAIQLPNGKSYTFDYQNNIYGLVDKITYPDGGTVSYEWGVDSLAGSVIYWDSLGANKIQPTCGAVYDVYAITKRTVSYDGVTPALEQDFSYYTTWNANDPSTMQWTNKVTDVTTKDLIAGTNTTVSYRYSGGYAIPTPTGVAYSGIMAPQESQIVYWDGLGGVSKSVSKVWGGGGLNGLVAEATTLCGLGASGVAHDCADGDFTDSSTTETYYSGYGIAPTEVDVYDLGSGGPSLSTTPPSSPLPVKKTVTAYQSFAASSAFPNTLNKPALLSAPCKVQIENGSGAVVSETDIYYDGQTTLCGAAATTASGSIALVSGLPSGTHDDAATLGTSGTNFDANSTAPRGNPTTVVKKCLTNCFGETDSIATATYDMTGQVRTVTDGCGNSTCGDMVASSHTTTYHYDDSPTSGNPAGGNSNAYLTEVDAPPSGSVTYPTYYSYNYATGRLASITDDNSVTTSYTYSDPLLRLTDVNGPTGHNHYCFADSIHSCPETGSTPSITFTNPTGASTVAILDGFGHTVQTQAISDPGGTDYVDTVYNGIGSVYSVTDPYRAGTTPAKMIVHYDAIGRTLSTTHTADSSVATVSYSGATTTLTDEAGVRAAQTTDGLGRLIQVQELGTASSPMNLTTHYSYDILGNMTQVNQIGNGSTDIPRVRNFTYDSLSRLIQSTNPETGNTCYGPVVSGTCSGSYDANGNLGQKTDARGVVTNFQYDGLNRLGNQSSSGGTGIDPYEYDYYYDLGVHGKGRLYEIYSDNTDDAEDYSYDSAGQIISEDRFNDSFHDGSASATYDSVERLSTLTYPSGRVVNYSYDSAGRVSKVYSIIGGVETDYLVSENFHPDGSPATVSYGNGVTQSFGKNQRLQLSSITASNGAGATLMSRSYSYSPSSGLASCPMTANNGNIWQITDNLNSGWTREFGYDCLNRLSNSQIGGTAVSYWLDSFGNMSPMSGGSPVNGFDNNNRINSLPCHVAYGLSDFDAVGNQLCDSDQHGAPRIYSLNSEGRISSVAMMGSSSPFEGYLYLPTGRTEKWSVDGEMTFYMPFNGKTIAEQDQHGNWTDYIYAGDKKIARAFSTNTRLHISGVKSATTDPNNWMGVILDALPSGITIQAGDVMSARVYQHNALPRFRLGFTNNTASTDCGGCDIPSVPADQWTNVSMPIGGTVASPGVLVGRTIAGAQVWDQKGAPSGQFDILVQDIAILHPDGTTVAIPVSLSDAECYPDYTAPFPYSDTSCIDEQVAAPGSALGAVNDVYYYLDDHLGTAQYEVSAGGWPIWEGQFMPYGQEITDSNTGTFNYKFTGQERDKKTGNDFFVARYFASSAGRFMSPDPSGMASANVASPQSLNLYSYARNNPIMNVDPTGLDCIYLGDDSKTIEEVDEGGCDKGSGGYWVPGHYNGRAITQDDGTLTGFESTYGHDGFVSNFADDGTISVNTMAGWDLPRIGSSYNGNRVAWMPP